jgi:hypothetical protein
VSVRTTECSLLAAVILPFDFCGCETWSVAVGKGEHTLKLFENAVLRKIFLLRGIK